MADIYIVYCREDHPVAEKLYGLLSQQWDTWWDDKIIGDFAKVIEEEIPKAGCVVPIFSKHSRSKATFTDELRLAQKSKKELLPIKLDESDAPYSFGHYSCSNMRNWNGEIDHPGFKQLRRRLAQVVRPRVKPTRSALIDNTGVSLPALFLSVSSYDTQLVPSDAVRALRVFGAPTILVSAYDLISRREPGTLIKELKKYRREGGFVLIDSGTYEASRLGDKYWSKTDLKEALSQTQHDLAFCFDDMNPNVGQNINVKETIETVIQNRDLTDSPVLPIVHAPKLKNGGYKLEHIPQIIRRVSEKLEPPLIAIPERELGAGLIARARTIQKIRQELSKLSFYQPLHILGTANPWSVAILTAAGADTFDGLEWCRMAIDRVGDRLHHFQHFDFFEYQASFADSIITREALKDTAIDFAGKVAFHNLDYFSCFLDDLREFTKEKNLEAFVVRLTGKDITNQLKKQVPGLFK